MAEDRLGWVVMPDRPDELADAIRQASRSVDTAMAERAVAAAARYSAEHALNGYAALVQELLRGTKAEQGR